jgi:hypothetical protein
MKKSLEKKQSARADPSFTLARKFWLRFIRSYWKKKPFLIRKPFAQLISSSTETFEALLAESEEYRRSNEQIPLDFYIDNKRSQEHETRKYLPQSTDPSLAGYFKRLSKELPRSRFALLAQHLQCHHPSLWFRLREFVHPLLETTGLPGEDTKVTAYMGNYRKTPIGIHPGRSESFLFVTYGVRRIRVWPEAYFRGKEQEFHCSLDYEEHNKGSILRHHVSPSTYSIKFVVI